MTGLIFGTIIAAWAAVLVPMWVRRHDERNEARSVERFSSAMRVLSRRSGAAGGRARSVVMPARADREDVHVSGPVSEHRAVRPAREAARPGGREAARPGGHGLARRRRRTLLALALVTVAALALGAMGLLPLWSTAVAGVVLVAFLVHLRAQARIAQQTAKRRAAAARRAAGRQQRLQQVDRLRRVPRTGSDVAAAEGGEPGAEVLAELGWDPRQVPLPTYVTKPSAPRAAGELDAAERATSAPAAQDAQDAVDEALDDELGEVLERRRVVGE